VYFFLSYRREQYQLLLEVEDYKNQCLDQLSKQTISIILFSMKNLINQYCKRNSRKVDDLLSAASCANSATNEFNKCNANYIDALLASQNTPDANMKIPQMCWLVKNYLFFFRFRKPIFNEARLQISLCYIRRFYFF